MQLFYSHQAILLLQVIPSCRYIIGKRMPAAWTPPKQFGGKPKRDSQKEKQERYSGYQNQYCQEWMILCQSAQLHILTQNNHGNKQRHAAQATSSKASPLYQEYCFRKGTASLEPGGASVDLFIILSSGNSLQSYTLL